MKTYEIRDPVYGFIKFDEWEREIINHTVFQRLRRIRQLALTDMVYPGAMHNRFEHSLGVMHLATEMYDSIIQDKNSNELLKEKLQYEDAGLERNRKLVRLAALLHDIGHAPFSHASEEIMTVDEKTKKKFKHEDYSLAIIKERLSDVIDNNPFNKTNFKITANEIAALIKGTDPKTVFWKTLISSQLDADRGDYLLRDAYHCGVKYGVYDVERLLVTLALGVDPETKDIILGVKEDGWHTAESLIMARYLMYTQVYFHRTREAYNIMLREAIKKSIGTLPPVSNLQDYINLDDYSIWDKIKATNNYWCKSILDRNHIRQIHETNESIEPEEEKYLLEIKERLKKEGIDFWEGKDERSWYEFEENHEKDKGGNKIKKDTKEVVDQVMIIIDKNKIMPLTEKSNIAKNIDKIKQIRLYVKPDDRDKANKIIEEIEK